MGRAYAYPKGESIFAGDHEIRNNCNQFLYVAAMHICSSEDLVYILYNEEAIFTIRKDVGQGHMALFKRTHTTKWNCF